MVGLVNTVWFQEGPPPRRDRTYYRVTWVGERQEVIIRRCDLSGRILKGARAMHRHAGAFLSREPQYQRKEG
jgi:hypothetical protein